MVSHYKRQETWYPTEFITDVDYTDDLALLANTSAKAECLLHTQEQAARGISLDVNTDKTEFMYFKQDGTIPTLNGKLLKLVDQFKYLDSNISSTESNVNIYIGRTWTAIDRL